MFVTLFAWAQSAAPGIVERSQDAPLAGLMTMGIGIAFVGWIVVMAIREVRRIRREEPRASVSDIYTTPVDDLGPTMADGGEPIARGRRKA